MRGRLSGRPDGAIVADSDGTESLLAEGREQNLIKEDIPDLVREEDQRQGENTEFPHLLTTGSRRLSHSHSEATLLDNSPEVYCDQSFL